ncbi:MAG TPA: hypothetical protein VFO69_07990, partial [Allosphingosinicella sp.]|nr:hypothetical protein [Allosphingosinicella sp.]
MSAQPVSLLGGYAGPPPILVVGSSETATKRASAVIEAAGYRAAPVDMKVAPDRIELQPAASG